MPRHRGTPSLRHRPRIDTAAPLLAPLGLTYPQYLVMWEDDGVTVSLSTPRELGGAGGAGTNPEQLFAAGYSACFIGAMKALGAVHRPCRLGGRATHRHRPAHAGR